MIVQSSSSVESQELHRVKEVSKSQDAAQTENSDKNDSSRDRVTISDEAREQNQKKKKNEVRASSSNKTVESGGKDLDSMKVAKQVLDEM